MLQAIESAFAPDTREGLAAEGQKKGGTMEWGTSRPSVSGWTERQRLLLWVVIGFLPSGLLVWALHRPLSRSVSEITLRSELPTKAFSAFFIVLATCIVSRMEKRSLADYGIPPRQAFGGRFWEGSIWGFAALSAMLLMIRCSGDLQIDSVSLSGDAALRYALGWAAVFLGVAITEEFAFRGYWLFVTSRRLRFWPAAVFLSLVFAFAHIPNPGENALGLLQVFAIGMLFCLTIRRTGNLWFAVGFHAAWDWAETFFYGTADSGLLGEGHYLNTTVHGANWIAGGSVGPEGSIFALVVLLLCALLIHFRFPTATYPDRPV
jgi:membrane protease YdiL (CAAX protease family)